VRYTLGEHLGGNAFGQALGWAASGLSGAFQGVFEEGSDDRMECDTTCTGRGQHFSRPDTLAFGDQPWAALPERRRPLREERRPLPGLSPAEGELDGALLGSSSSSSSAATGRSHPSGLSFPTAKPGQSFGRDQAPGGGFIQEEGLETEDSDQDQDQDQEEWEPHSPPAQPRPRKSGTSGRLRGL
ncbi:unnamed protein product, partial [Polarella glacialis]